MSDQKLIFVHIPKNAGTTIKKWDEDNEVGLLHYKHKTLAQLNKRFKKHLDKKSFAVTRNTYERLISYYLYDKANPIKPIPQQLKANESFESWFHYCVKAKASPAMSQLSWIYGVDYVLSSENLEEDFKVIQELTGCFEPLGFENTNPLRESKIELFEDDKIMNIISTHFAAEIEHFGYKRP